VIRVNRDKGAQIEREVVARHAEIEVKAERVLSSAKVRAGVRAKRADIDVYAVGPGRRSSGWRRRGRAQVVQFSVSGGNGEPPAPVSFPLGFGRTFHGPPGSASVCPAHRWSRVFEPVQISRSNFRAV
jgi:hypothetical protein